MAGAKENGKDNGGFFSRVFGGGGGAKKAKRADLGEELKMYYNEELKCYVERGKEHEVQVGGVPPPPPMKSKAVKKNNNNGSVAAAGTQARYATAAGLSASSSGPNLHKKSASFTAPPVNGSSGPSLFVPTLVQSSQGDAALPQLPVQTSTQSGGTAVPPAAAPGEAEPVLADSDAAASGLDERPTVPGSGAEASAVPQEPPHAGTQHFDCTADAGTSEAASNLPAVDPLMDMAPTNGLHEADGPVQVDATSAVDALGGSGNVLAVGVDTGVDVSVDGGAPAGQDVDDGWVAPDPYADWDYDQWDGGIWGELYNRDPRLFYYHFWRARDKEGWGEAEWAQYAAEEPAHYEYLTYYMSTWGQDEAAQGTSTEESLQPAVADAADAASGQPNGHAYTDGAAAVGASEAQGYAAYEGYAGSAHAHDAAQGAMSADSVSAPNMHADASAAEPTDAHATFVDSAQDAAVSHADASAAGASTSAAGAANVSIDGTLAGGARPGQVDGRALSPANDTAGPGLGGGSIAQDFDDYDGGVSASVSAAANDWVDPDDIQPAGDDGGDAVTQELAAVMSDEDLDLVRDPHSDQGQVSQEPADEDAGASRHASAMEYAARQFVPEGQREGAGYNASSVQMSDAVSDAASSVYVQAPSLHAPSEVVSEDPEAAAPGMAGALPSMLSSVIPEAGPEGQHGPMDEPLEPTVLPPMFGEVPSADRPEINISDLQRVGVRFGNHSMSVGVEIASTSAISEAGSVAPDERARTSGASAGPSAGRARDRGDRSEADSKQPSHDGGDDADRRSSAQTPEPRERGSAEWRGWAPPSGSAAASSRQDGVSLSQMATLMAELHGALGQAAAQDGLDGPLQQQLRDLERQNLHLLDELNARKLVQLQQEELQQGVTPHPSNPATPSKVEPEWQALRTPATMSAMSTPYRVYPDNDSAPSRDNATTNPLFGGTPQDSPERGNPQLHELQQQLAAIQSDMDALQQENMDLRGQLTRANDALAQRDEQITAMQDQIHMLQAQLQAAQEQAGSSSTHAQLQQLQDQLAEKEEDFNDLLGALGLEAARVEALKEQLEVYGHDVDALLQNMDEEYDYDNNGEEDEDEDE